MKKKKLHEMTPQEKATMNFYMNSTPEEQEEALFEMIADPPEGVSKELIYPLIRAHAKEKLLKGKVPECLFYRFFYCDLEESLGATQKIYAAVAQEKHEEAQSYMKEILHILMNYASYYANMCNREPQKIIDDVSIFIETLEFFKNEKGEFCYVLYAPISDYLKIGKTENIHIGWALQVGGEDPRNDFEEVYGELTAAVEIALLALWEIYAPLEAFKSVYRKLTERALQYGKPEGDISEYTEKNKDFDFWLDDTKDTITHKIRVPAAQEPNQGKENEPLFTEIDGQQVIREAYPTISKAVELVPRTAISDVFRRGGIPKTAFNLKYSPALYQGDGFTAAIEKIGELKNSLSDRADKLLTSIENAYITTHPSDNIVYIDFFDFCDKCKYNTSKRENIKVAKTNIRNDLNDIALPTFTADGANGDFVNVKFIGSHGVITPKKGDPYIMCAVDPVYAKMMNRGQLTRYPRTVYQYTGTPYNVVKKLYEHYCMDSNVKRGTNVILSVKSILAASGLKETPRTQKLWRSELKERLENALDVLKAGGDLKDWKYCKAKKEPLTDKEAQEIINNTYGYYKGLYITFELEQLPDDTERLIKNEQRREELEDKKARAALKAAETVIKNEEKKKNKRAPRGKGKPTKG